MPLFSRKPKPELQQGTAPEHAVLLTYQLSDDEFGAASEREEIFALEDRLAAAVTAAGVGELDGDEFGAGEVVIYLYGPDCARLWAVIEAEARNFPARPAHGLLRAGGPDVSPDRVDL